MKRIKIIIGAIVAFIALIVLIVFMSGYLDYFRFRPILQDAKYPQSIYWKTDYTAAGGDSGAGMTACFNTHDSKDSVLDYYQTFFKNKGWVVDRTDISPFDNSHTRQFRLELQTQDTKVHGSLDVNGNYEGCKFILGIW
jgi:hypothetical protein